MTRLLLKYFFLLLVLPCSLQVCNPRTADAPLVHVNHIADFDPLLRESSGLAMHDGYLWTINDSGAEPVVHKLDKNGNLLKSIHISGASNIDWESLASDEQFLFIADTGNNFNRRDSLEIYRVSWSSLESSTQSVELIEVRYSDYRAGNSLGHNFDSEALAVNGDELWLFTKNRGDQQTNLYRFPKLPGSYSPSPGQSLPVNSLVTAADINPETGELLLIGNRRGERDYLWRMPTSNEGVDWEQSRVVEFSPIDQWEAVLWNTEADSILLTHEQNATNFAGLGEISP